MRNRSKTLSSAGIASAPRTSATRPRHPRRRRCLGTALVAALSFAPTLACAQTDYWDPTSNGYWDVASNWSLGLPTLAEDVVNNTGYNLTFRQNTVTVNSFLNSSTGNFTLTGGALSTTTFFENSGTGSVTLSGGTLNVGSNVLNTSAGTFQVSGATLNVTGNFTNSGTGKLTFSSGATTVNGNLLSEGTLSLTGGTLAGAGASVSSLEVDNTFTVSSGTLSNFTINPGVSGSTSYGVNLSGGTLANATVNGVAGSSLLAFSQNSTNTLNNVTVNGDLDIGNNSTVLAPNALTVSGTLNIGTSSNQSGTLEFSNATASSTAGIAKIVLGSGTLYTGSEGIIQQAAGNTLTIAPSTTIQVANGNLYGVNGGATGTTLINQGTIVSNSGGYVEVYQTTFNNQGTFMISPAGTNNSGEVTIFATTFTNSGTIEATNGGLINGLEPTTNTGVIAAIGSSTGERSEIFITGANSYFTNSGTIEATNVNSSFGGDIYIGCINFTNSGTLSATNGSTLTLTNYNGSGNILLNGTISADSTSTLYLQGTVSNGGTAFTIASGALTLEGGELQNAVVNVSNGATGLAFAFNSSASTLDNVTINNSNLNIYGAGVLVPDALTVSGNTNIGTYGGVAGNLVFSNATANSTSGLSNIVLASSGGNIEQIDGNTLTVAAGTTIHGYYGNIGSLYNTFSVGDTLINQGTINSDSGGSLYINDTTFTNSGTLEATNGSSLWLSKTNQFTGGQVLVDRTSSLYSLATASNTQTGGTITVDGNFTANVDAGSTSNGGLALQGGVLGGSGKFTGTVNNTGGTVTPGDGVGTLTISGNYTQSANGILEIALGGTQQGGTYDLLKVTNQATLAGELEINLVNGFTPTVGETFNFLTYSSHSGQFSEILSLNPSYTYDVNYGSGVATLVVAASSVPETSTFVTASLMLTAGALLLRRRRQAQDTTKRAA
jgi:hypothetical protein